MTNDFTKATILGYGVSADNGSTLSLEVMQTLYGPDSGYRAFMAAMGCNVTADQPINVPIRSLDHFKELVKKLKAAQ